MRHLSTILLCALVAACGGSGSNGSNAGSATSEMDLPSMMTEVIEIEEMSEDEVQETSSTPELQTILPIGDYEMWLEEKLNEKFLADTNFNIDVFFFDNQERISFGGERLELSDVNQSVTYSGAVAGRWLSTNRRFNGDFNLSFLRTNVLELEFSDGVPFPKMEATLNSSVPTLSLFSGRGKLLPEYLDYQIGGRFLTNGKVAGNIRGPNLRGVFAGKAE